MVSVPTSSVLNENLLRLSTFAAFPRSCPIYSSHFSSAGFTYSGKSDLVMCSACGLEVDNWDGQSLPFHVHKQNSPTCPLVQKLSGINSCLNSKPGLQSMEDRCSEPDHIKSEKIKEDVAYNSGSILISKHDGNLPCDLSKIRENEQNHRYSKDQPDGPNSGSTLESGYFSSQSQYSHNNVPSPSWIPYTSPRYPQYFIMYERLNTYNRWPRYLPQTPEDLARAGFFYTGVNDLVRCFHCGGGLTSWESEDNPWVEHAHWFPQCVFLRQNKGDEFIKVVQSMVDQLGPEQQYHQSNIADALCEVGSGIAASGSSCSETSSIEELIAVKSVKEMGYSIDIIKPAYTKAVEKYKTNKISAVQLMEVVLEMEEHQASGGTMVPIQATEESSTNPLRLPQQQTDESTGCEAASSIPVIQPPCIQYETTTGECKGAPDVDINNKDLLLCKVCMEEQVSIVFLPCGHLATCGQCAPAMKKCPICRQHVRGSVKTFLS